MSQRKDIDTLSSDISRLRIEYEQYFMRILKREPINLRCNIERRILIYSNKSLSNTALKFRLNSEVAKYNSYKQYWVRILRAIEEGTYVRRAEGSGGACITKNEAPIPHAPDEPGSADIAKNKSTDKNAEADPIAKAYKEYIETRKKQNEPVKGLSLEKFMNSLEASKKKVADKYKTDDIEVEVSVKDGRTRLTLKPKKK